MRQKPLVVLLLAIATLASSPAEVAASCPAPATPSMTASPIPIIRHYRKQFGLATIEITLVSNTYSGAFTLKVSGWIPLEFMGESYRFPLFDIATIVNGKSPIPFQFGAGGREFKLTPIPNWRGSAAGFGVIMTVE
jgi:hypothetical protein